MNAFTRLFASGVVASSFLLGAVVAAQDDDLGMADAVVSGDLNSACAVAVQEFFRTRDMSVLGANVTFSDPETMGTGMTGGDMSTGADTMAGDDMMATEEGMDTAGADTMAGEDTIGTMGSMMQPMLFDMAAFGDGLYDIRSIVVGDTLVVVEFTFSGTNTGDFMGQAATNMPVSTPAVAIFACENDAVTDVRLYYDRAGMMSQMGMGMDMGASMTGADTMAGADTAAGADTMAGADTAMATEEGMDTTGADTAVGADTTGADTAAADTTAGMDTTGADTTAGMDTLAGGDTAAAGMDTLPPDPYALLDAITDDPAAYMGQTVTVAGPITELAGGMPDNGFIIVEEDLIGDDPALILGATPDVLAGSTWAVDQQVIVTGVVRGMVIADLEAELGYDLADELYGGYEAYPVIVASEVGPYDPNAPVSQ